jgi:hypothetical protein
MTPSEALVWFNIVLTIGGFVTLYVRVIERLTRLETNNKHIMHKLKMSNREEDGS